MNQIQVCAFSGTCLFKKHFSILFLNNQEPFLGKYILNILLFFCLSKIFLTEESSQSYFLQDLVKNVTVTKMKLQPYQKKESLYFHSQ